MAELEDVAASFLFALAMTFLAIMLWLAMKIAGLI